MNCQRPLEGSNFNQRGKRKRRTLNLCRKLGKIPLFLKSTKPNNCNHSKTRCRFNASAHVILLQVNAAANFLQALQTMQNTAKHRILIVIPNNNTHKVNYTLLNIQILIKNSVKYKKTPQDMASNNYQVNFNNFIIKQHKYAEKSIQNKSLVLTVSCSSAVARFSILHAFMLINESQVINSSQ